MSSIEFQRSTVVITGVTRGLGRAMVDEFVRLGHMVLGCARTKTEIEDLSGEYPGQDFQVVNVASDAEVKAWAAHVSTKYGSPDFLLNNAAVINSKGPLWEIPDSVFSNVIDINIKGTVNVIRRFSPSMMNRKHGVIVNVSSRWGRKFEKQMAPYCATKWAVAALTRVLAEELRPHGVAAVELNPGTVKTGMLQSYLGNTAVAECADCPTPAEWAKIAVPFILRLSLKDTGTLCRVFNAIKYPTFTQVA